MSSKIDRTKIKSAKARTEGVRKLTKVQTERTDWNALATMTDADIAAAAMTDKDNRPLADQDLKRMKRRPRVFVMRRALQLSQEAFAARFQIPLGTLRDWEQGRTEPDQAATAYLKVIAADAEFVARVVTSE